MKQSELKIQKKKNKTRSTVLEIPGTKTFSAVFAAVFVFTEDRWRGRRVEPQLDPCIENKSSC